RLACLVDEGLGAVERVVQALDHRQAVATGGQTVNIRLEHVGILHPDVEAAGFRDLGQRGVAVAAGGVEAQYVQPVSGGVIQREPGVGGAVKALDVAGACSLGTSGVNVPAQATRIGIGAGAAARAVHRFQPVFDHGLGFSARDAEFPELVVEGKDLDDVGRRDVALQRNADTAAALQGEVGAPVLGVGHVKVSLGNQLLDVAAPDRHTALRIAGGAGAAVVH